jgi:Ca2+-binding EF-hand superfamily protein
MEEPASAMGASKNTESSRPVLADSDDDVEDGSFGFDENELDEISTNQHQVQASGNVESTQKSTRASATAATQDRAASIIQAGVRGYMVRKKTKKDIVERTKAATKLQAGYRGYSVRKLKRKRAKAATLIQANFRGHIVRRKGKIVKGVDGLFRAFGLIDVDGDGKVSRVELETAIAAGNKPILHEIDLSSLFDRLDVDNDGAVSITEFLQGMSGVLIKLGIEEKGDLLAMGIEHKQREAAAAQREVERVKNDKLETELRLKREAARLKSQQRQEVAAKKRAAQEIKEAEEMTEKAEELKRMVQHVSGGVQNE